MCRSARVLVMALGLLAAASAWGGAVPLAAQDAPTEAELVQALDSLVPALRAAQAAADSVRALRRARALERQAEMDTVQVGAAMVVTRRGEAGHARDVMAPVWEEEYAAWAGADPASAGPWVAFQWSPDRMEFNLRDRTLVRVQGAAWRPRSYMEEGARTAFGNLLTRELRETRMGRWLDGAPLRQPQRPGWIYRGMATAASAPVRACLDGEVAACGIALSLELDETPFDEWYTPEQRRLFVRRNAELWARRPGHRPLLDGCLAGDGEACDAALAAYRDFQLGGPQVAGSHPYWGAPLPSWIRASFLWHAVREGEAGTWRRLVAAAEAGMEPGPALERATGRDVETLLAGWRDWVLEQRPRRENRAGGAAFPALLWAALFLTFATRSTRWRSG